MWGGGGGGGGHVRSTTLRSKQIFSLVSVQLSIISRRCAEKKGPYLYFYLSFDRIITLYCIKSCAKSL